MKKYGKNWICWLIWIGIWQLADLFIHNNVIFAGPVNMAVTLAGLLKDGDFWLSLLHSAFRICSGFLSAFFLGILLGSLGWAFPLVKEFLKPPMLMIRCVPVASFVILALIWIGSENLSVFISFLVVVPMIYGATLAGLENMDKAFRNVPGIFHAISEKSTLSLCPGCPPISDKQLPDCLGNELEIRSCSRSHRYP